MRDNRGASATPGWPTEARRSPAPTLPAATAALLREADAGREVLLLLRPPHSSFAPDHWVFPGGRVDDADHAIDHAAFTTGRAAEAWARTMSIEESRSAGAFPIAALREIWEETGILLAEGPRASLAAAEARRSLLAERADLTTILRDAGLKLATDRLRYIGRRITPAWLPRRFDTRFFLTHVERSAVCTLEGPELTAFRWMPPAAALAAAATGEMKLLPPTSDLLRFLVGENGAAALWPEGENSPPASEEPLSHHQRNHG